MVVCARVTREQYNTLCIYVKASLGILGIVVIINVYGPRIDNQSVILSYSFVSFYNNL